MKPETHHGVAANRNYELIPGGDPMTRIHTAVSKLVHQITDANTQGLGKTYQGGNTGGFFASFQFTDINRMQLGLFGQFFLTQFRKLPKAADRFANDFLMSQTLGHAFSGKQEAREINTVHNPLFFPCIVLGSGVKKHADSKNDSVDMAENRRFMSDKAKILVMDRQLPVVLHMVHLLTLAGFDVTTVLNGQKGFKLATENRFDLIILDVDLPGTNGFGICSELKQRHISYQTPIIFVSDPAGLETRQRAMELGAADFIEKPFEARDFVSRIASHLEATTLARNQIVTFLRLRARGDFPNPAYVGRKNSHVNQVHWITPKGKPRF